jgi:hypothetical protein
MTANEAPSLTHLKETQQLIYFIFFVVRSRLELKQNKNYKGSFATLFQFTDRSSVSIIGRTRSNFERSKLQIETQFT